MRTDVIVVGQTPPPTHGQAVMVEALLRMRDPEVGLHHVRLAFSDDLADVGRFQWSKITELSRLCRSILRLRRATGSTVLYLAVGGASLIPLVRDTVILGVTRRRFTRVILHIHGAGVGGVLARLPGPLRRVILAIMGRPDVVIQLTAESPPDGSALRAREVVVVPNGIPDLDPPGTPGGAPPAGTRYLYLGTLRETKGILVVLEAMAALVARGVDASLTLAGAPVDTEFADRLRERIDALGLTDVVALPGQISGDEKLTALLDSDVFVFPSFYSGENQSVAVVEAMRAGLPVIAARWRGAESLVDDGVSGLLVEPRSAIALADAMAELGADVERCASMGRAGRARFLRDYTEEQFHQRMAAVLTGRPESVEAAR